MFSNDQIEDILKPLQDKSIYSDAQKYTQEYTQEYTKEYQRQKKMLLEFQRKLRSLESLYADVYAQISRIELQLRSR